MSEFGLEKELSSYEVTVDLITRIETYLFTKVPGLTNIDPNEIKSSYSIQIADDFGTEKFGSIKEYSGLLFGDYTNEIMIHSSSYLQKSFTFTLKFNKEGYLSHITIKFKDDNAREITISIFEGIKRILDLNRTNNRFFHPSAYIEGALSAVAFMSVWIMLGLFAARLYYWGLVVLPFSLFLVLYLNMGKKIYPYVAFDSNKYRNNKKWSNLFLYTLVVIIISNLVLPFILNYYGI
jgi:hypothetical protein